MILKKIGNKIGRLLKIDACTSSTLRGRYARLCIELPLEVLVIPFIFIGQHKQVIHYEDDNILCKKYGRLGHAQSKCQYRIVFNAPSPTELNSTTSQSKAQKELLGYKEDALQSINEGFGKR